MPTTTAREIFTDYGEALDVYQVRGFGGVVQTGQQINGQSYGNLTAQDNLTAKAGGGQVGATPITSPLARITIVVTAGDSVILPLSQRGFQVSVVNDAAANSCNVFPAVGDAINSLGVNTAFPLAVATTGPTIFYCFSAGLWRTK